MDSEKLVRQIIVSGVPTPPAGPLRSNAGEPRPPRERGPRPKREPNRKRDSVEIPTELSAAQLAAIQFFTNHDANNY
jgi:hypothetical protein